MSCKNDSILATIIKRFTGTFFSVIGFFLALLIFSAIIGVGFKSAGMNLSDTLAMHIKPSKNGMIEPVGKKDPVILQIDVHGIIGEMPGSKNTSEMVQKILRQPALYGISKDRIKGIILNINSVGGSAAESDEIYEDLMAYKKELGIPIHAWIGDVCASGGYYIATTSDYISAQRISIIGSVGVVYGPRFNVYGFMKEHGFEATTISAGKSKVHFPMFHEMPKTSPPPYQDFINMIEKIYSRFLDVVVEARGKHGLTRENLMKYGAQVYSSSDALNLGYIDKAGVRYNDAVDHFASVLGVQDQGYKVVSFTPHQTTFRSMQMFLKEKFSFLFKADKSPIRLEADLYPTAL